jgi:hypothetical protein
MPVSVREISKRLTHPSVLSRLFDTDEAFILSFLSGSWTCQSAENHGPDFGYENGGQVIWKIFLLVIPWQGQGNEYYGNRVGY